MSSLIERRPGLRTNAPEKTRTDARSFRAIRFRRRYDNGSPVDSAIGSSLAFHLLHGRTMRWRCAFIAATLAVTVVSAADAQASAAPRRFCLEERGPEQCWATVLLSPSIHAIAGTSGDASFTS